ncbi:protein of unknown function [Candidatus Filomicrobium marinum]|uniref:Uncharacterized protein n=2 Tax=Filomicrobium TaxID=119044 RepID=A0A0D6JK29_9HYPH|nr:protein of unknown function [Candidatus Filomicrobium marinum]CPR22344.1 protein of unknown function [Candidatus Filomicrobium marinum]SDO87825.1 hypothetical protein SAMN04488061_1894 [Filomicrobium insigne]
MRPALPSRPAAITYLMGTTCTVDAVESIVAGTSGFFQKRTSARLTSTVPAVLSQVCR